MSWRAGQQPGWGWEPPGDRPGGYSLSRIGALRSLIWVTFFSLVPLQMSCRRAPRPRCSSRLSFGGSVFAWRQAAAQEEPTDPQSRHSPTPPSHFCTEPSGPLPQEISSRGSDQAAPGYAAVLQGEAETPSDLQPRCSSLTATCRVPCSPPRALMVQRTLTQRAKCGPFHVQTLLQGKLRPRGHPKLS